MWGQAKGSFWAQDDNKVMLRHVLAMAGVSSSLALCLQASALQPELAYAEENTPNASAQIETVFRADDVAFSSSLPCTPASASDQSRSLNDIAIDTASAEGGSCDVEGSSGGSHLNGGSVANSSVLTGTTDDSDSIGAMVSASGSETHPQLKGGFGSLCDKGLA